MGPFTSEYAGIAKDEVPGFAVLLGDLYGDRVIGDASLKWDWEREPRSGKRMQPGA